MGVLALLVREDRNECCELVVCDGDDTGQGTAIGMEGRDRRNDGREVVLEKEEEESG